MVKVNIYLSTIERLKVDNTDYDTCFAEGNLALFSKIVEKDSYKVSYGFSYGSTPKTSTFSCKISAEPYYIKAFEAYNAIKVTKVKDGTETTVFLGCKPTIKRTYETADWWSETITFSDYSQDLSDIPFHEKEDKDDDWEWVITADDGYKVCDSTDTTKSLIHYLFENWLNKDRGSLSFTLHCGFSNTDSVSSFSVQASDKVLNVWQELLKQQGLAVYVIGLDFYILDMLADTPTTATTIYSVECNATINEKPYIEHTIPSLRVPSVIHTFTDKELYNSGKISVGKGSLGTVDGSITIKPKWFPDEKHSSYAEPNFTTDLENYEVIRYYNMKWDYETTISLGLTKFYLYNGTEKIEQALTSKGSWFGCSGTLTGKLLKYAVANYSMSDGNFTLKLTGDVDVADYNAIIMPPKNSYYSGNEEKANYVYTYEEGDRYMNALLYAREMEGKTYSFYSTQELALNEICVLSHISEADTYIRITEKQDNLDDFEGYTYSATVYSGEKVTTNSYYVPASTNAPNVSHDFNFSVSRNLIVINSDGTPIDDTPITAKINILKYYDIPHLYLGDTELELVQDTETVEGETVLLDSYHCEIAISALTSSTSTLKATLGDTEKIITVEKVESGKGEKGDSITISSVSYTYGNSDSGTVKPETFSTDTAPEKGKYYWTKTSITYSDSTVTDTYTVAYVGTDGQGEICTITCDRNFVTRNDRATDTIEYIFTVDVQGYTSTPTIQFNFLEDPVTPTQITGTTKWTYAVSLAQKNASSVTATVYLDSVEKDSITLGVVNETGNAKYFGTFTELPTSNTGYISGDSLVYNKLVYLFNGTTWQKTTESSLSTSEKATALSLAMKDVLSGIDKNTLTASEYAYIENVVANIVTADYIGAKNITVDEKGSLQSSNYTNTDNGITGFKLNGSDGSIYANKTVLTNATISGDFYAKSLETQNENQNGSYYATTGFPSEACTASTTVLGPDSEGTITTVGTLTNTQDNYYKTADFAQWCLDNIPINRFGFTQLDGIINGNNAYACRFDDISLNSEADISPRYIAGATFQAGDQTKSFTVDFGKYTETLFCFQVTVSEATTITKNTAWPLNIYCDDNLISTITRDELKEAMKGSNLPKKRFGYLPHSSGVHVIKGVFANGSLGLGEVYLQYALSLDIYYYSFFHTDEAKSSNILLMLYSGTDDSAVFNGGTADNPLKVISINSDISDNTTMTKLMQANTTDTGYNTLATNLSYNGSSLICGGTETGWTVTRYAKFLGLYNCGTGSWTTPTLAESLSAKVKNVYINGTAQSQEFTVQWNGTALTLVSDDKTVSYLLSTSDYYTSLPYFCMTGIARSKGAYVSSLFPLTAGVSDIGSASQPFDQIYANSYMNMYPVGAIYISTKPTSPASLFGGQWTALDENHTLWTTAWTDSTTTDLTSESPISAGLPNITGSIQGVADGGTSTHEITGAFNSESNVSSKVAFRNGSYTYAFYISAIRTFDASAGEVHNGSYSNLVYGKSDTVQPPAYKIYAWKRIS